MKKRGDFSNAQILNPKRYADAGGAQEARIFPYYAGYSTVFASTLLGSLVLPAKCVVFDPWNGSGVTTHTARRFGYRTVGQDLNPVMVLAAKAELLSPQDAARLIPLAHYLLDNVRGRLPATESDPLCQWLVPRAASFMRALEERINMTLVSKSTKYAPLSGHGVCDRVSPMASFFYVVLFGVARGLLDKFRATNPMWTKSPAKRQYRIRASRRRMTSLFIREVRLLSGQLAVHSFLVTDKERTCEVLLGSSEHIPLRTRSVDVVLTSPPYCTRIDYAVATAIELAVLRIGGTAFDALRRSMMGTSTVGSDTIVPSNRWGRTCNRFLQKLYRHKSKASKTYYYKNHVQYFASLYASIGEIARVLRRAGRCAIVVQDSYYKDVRNDVPKVVVEMARAHGVKLDRRETFISTRSMVRRNSRARGYVSRRKAREHVLCFVRK